MNDPLPDWLVFWQRPFPSANTLLIQDQKPVLIDSRYNTGKAVSTDTCRPQGSFVITRSMEAEACGIDIASE